MSVEDSNSPVPPPQGDPVVTAGLEIAVKWGAALGGPEHLKVALQALEPQLKREHQLRLKQLEIQREASERQASGARERRHHVFRMTGLYLGAVISVAMLSAGIYVAQDVWWLATLLCGPSLIAMGKIFVLRRSDADDMTAISRGARASTNAAAQAQPPVP
ncbi:hypothetical protein ACFYRC_38060 [Streptomyces sp. NPDC005279]|uniref:hypothetical protein n=1 Tax=Streptomyces sp. NPDC005279 TaxID=3364712 RepID=UPI0036A5362A